MSFAQIDSFERALNYLDNGRIKVNEIVTQEIPLKEWGKAVDFAWKRQGIKTALIRGSILPITGGCRPTIIVLVVHAKEIRRQSAVGRDISRSLCCG